MFDIEGGGRGVLFSQVLMYVCVNVLSMLKPNKYNVKKINNVTRNIKSNFGNI